MATTARTGAARTLGAMAAGAFPTQAYGRAVGRYLGLPGTFEGAVRVEQDLRIPMEDGVVLLADRYVPRAAGARPTVLVRSPYGRRGFYGFLYGLLYAQRGLQVVVQSTRGTFGSGGEFMPFHERADGLATIAWIRRQPWHRGKIGMTGASYMGLAQWAVARDAGDVLGALTPAVTASQFHGATFGGGFALDSTASWHAIVALQEQPFAPIQMYRAIRRLRSAFARLPLGELDTQVNGRPLAHYREALEKSARDDPYWVARDHAHGVGDVSAPVLLVAGWHDIFTPWQLDDYVALRRAGRQARLVVGPWTHTSPGMWQTSARESIRWLRGHLLEGVARVPQARVRVHVGGADQWRYLEEWPPPEAREWRLHLHPGGDLGPDAPMASKPDRYRYDPAHPTPSSGGPALFARKPVVDNRPLERRPDVLTYTTAPLEQPVEAIGPVRVEIFVRSTLEHFDVFARVCDVDRQGVSRNVCDALDRVTPKSADRAPDGTIRVAFSLWPTAHRFSPHHRIRLQMSSGAHPRYARNTGTGEPLATATRLRAADQEVFHDPQHPSALVLSVVGPIP